MWVNLFNSTTLSIYTSDFGIWGYLLSSFFLNIEDIFQNNACQIMIVSSTGTIINSLQYECGAKSI